MKHFALEFAPSLDIHALLLKISFDYSFLVANYLDGKATWFFHQLKHLIEGTVALIQQLDSIEQCSDV